MLLPPKAERISSETADCPFIQSRGVHFSDTGKQFTALVAAGAIMQYL